MSETKHRTPDISLFASSVRPHLWPMFFKSLEATKLDIEVVFAGDLVDPPKYPNLKYITTDKRIPPAQCYEIARRNSIGITCGWTADDCEYDPYLLDDCYEVLKNNDKKTIIAIETNEDGRDCDINNHRFFGDNVNTYQMAPVNLMYREYLNDLGGFDSRFLCGQYENKCVTMALIDGAKIIKYTDKKVRIEHLKKHGSSTKFWTGYDYDRKVLEDAYVLGGYKPSGPAYLTCIDHHKTPPMQFIRNIVNREVLNYSQTGFVPYKDENLTTISQCPKEWPPIC